MATWSDWFKEAHSRGIPLEHYLSINQPADLQRLHDSGLPYYDFLLVDGLEYESKKPEIERFVQKHASCWVRVSNKKVPGKRQYALNLTSFLAVTSYIERLGLDLREYHLQIFEFAPNKFGGNIVSDDRGLALEIVEGNQELVSKSAVPFFHILVEPTGTIQFKEPNIPDLIRQVVPRILEYLRLERNQFLQGYFEFVVNNEGKIYFLDYKTSFG